MPDVTRRARGADRARRHDRQRRRGARAARRAGRRPAEGDAKRGSVERAIRLARSHGDLEAVLELERELAQLARRTSLALRWRLESTLAQLGRDDERARAARRARRARDRRDPARGTALLAAARLRERAGAVEPATELYRQVLALWPDDTFARESLIDLLRAQERWTELVDRAPHRGARAARRPGRAPRAARGRVGARGPARRRSRRPRQVYDEWLIRIARRSHRARGRRALSRALGDRAGEVTARARDRRARRQRPRRSGCSRARSSAPASSTRPPTCTARARDARGAVGRRDQRGARARRSRRRRAPTR